jgi:hypothetical protein
MSLSAQLPHPESCRDPVLANIGAAANGQPTERRAHEASSIARPPRPALEFPRPDRCLARDSNP